MLNFRQFEVVEGKVKIAPSKDASQNILEIHSWPLFSERFHHRACHRANIFDILQFVNTFASSLSVPVMSCTRLE